MIAESTHTANLREAEMILARRKSELIQDVILDDKRISKFHAAIDAFAARRAVTVEVVTTAVEDMYFPLPRELRESV